MNEVFGIVWTVCSIMTLIIVVQILSKVMRLERQLVKPLQLSDAAKELARDPRQKIAAIKQVRDETGCGLAEAKDAVEAYIRTLTV
jgi:nitrate/nitrite-specific signal transduction histidine kinase